MKNSQELLYRWFNEVEDVRYQHIKQTCEYLNIKLNLNSERPVYDIFYPLLYNGIVEFVGNNKYHITPECIISKFGEFNIILNPKTTKGLQPTKNIGIYISKKIDKLSEGYKYNFNLESILGNMPSLDNCILSMPETQDITKSEYEQNDGVILKNTNNIKKWYFICKKLNKCFVIHHPSINPDALNIAYCYDKVIKNGNNGTYDYAKKEIKINALNIPILIYRTLMIESLFAGSTPNIDNDYYVFKNISRRAYIELNRIYCNSIQLK